MAATASASDAYGTNDMLMMEPLSPVKDGKGQGDGVEATAVEVRISTSRSFALYCFDPAPPPFLFLSRPLSGL